MKKVSIIVPAYNCENTIKKCIDSLVNQTYKNIEIIIINDGSTDKTKELIIKNYKEKNEVILINQKNAGVSCARNKGIEISNGDYISFVDSDDWVEPNFIETMVKTLEEKNVDIVRCNYIKENKNESIKCSLHDLANKKMFKNEIYTSNINNYLLYFNKDWIPNYVMLLLIKKNILTNKIRFDKELYMLEDVAFYQKLLNKINSIYFLDEHLYHYNNINMSATRDPKRVEKNIIGIVNSGKYISEYMKSNNIPFYEKDMNAKSFDLIIYYLKKLSNNTSAKEFNSTLKNIYKNQDFKKIIKKINTNKFSKGRKAMILLFRLNLKRIIYILLKLKSK